LDTAPRAKPRYATIKARNIGAIPDALRELGADPDAVMRRAGVEPSLFSCPDNILPFAALGRLISECVRTTGHEDFGLRVGARTGATGIGLAGLVSILSATVRDAIQVVGAGLKTSDTGGTTFLDVRGDVASFGYVIMAPNIESADHIVDGAIAIILNIMRSLIGPAWRPIRVRLTRDPPRDRLMFSRVFEAPVDYGAPAASLIFDAAALDAPVSGRNPDYAAILAPILEEAMANAEDDFLSSVRSIIRSQIGAGALSRDSVCRALALNTRTFAHRLEAFDVTYSGLKD
jgi:hypothetical protein